MSARTTKLILIVITSLLLASCAKKDDVDVVASDVSLLRTELAQAETRIAELEKRQQFDPWAANFALLSPTSQGFALATTEYGRVAIWFDDIRPLGAGSRATLKVVNLTAADFTDIKVDFNYANKSFEEMLKGDDSVELKSHEGNAQITETLQSGTETRFSINLEHLPPDEVKFLSVKLQPSGIQFRRSR